MSKGFRANFKRYTFVLCCTFILSLGSLGIGWGMWSEEVGIEATIVMGELDPHISLSCFNVINGLGDARVNLPAGWEDLKGYSFEITGAHPETIIEFNFVVYNEGSLPFFYQCVREDNSPVNLQIEGVTSGVVPAGGIDEGKIIITSGDTAEGEDYTFELKFLFRQWNEM